MDNGMNYTYDARLEGKIWVMEKLAAAKPHLYKILEKIKCLKTLRK